MNAETRSMKLETRNKKPAPPAPPVSSLQPPVSGVQPGDIFIVPTQDGSWGPRLTFIRVDRDNPRQGIFEDQQHQSVRYFFRDLINPVAEPIRTAPVRKRRGPSHPITADQRRMVFALAKGRGMSTDDIRELTPAGSISALSTGQASQLNDALRAKRSAELTAATGPEGFAQGVAAIARASGRSGAHVNRLYASERARQPMKYSRGQRTGESRSSVRATAARRCCRAWRICSTSNRRAGG